MIKILVIILVVIALIITFYPAYCRLNQDREINEGEKAEVEQVKQMEGFIGAVGSPPVPAPPVPVPPPAVAGPVLTEGFCAFGGMPVPPGWREGNRAWPGWNTSSPFGPHSSTPSVWY